MCISSPSSFRLLYTWKGICYIRVTEYLKSHVLQNEYDGVKKNLMISLICIQ